MRFFQYALSVFLLAIAIFTIRYHYKSLRTNTSSSAEIGTAEDPYARQNWERMRMVDPETQEIPDNIFAREALFAKSLPTNQSLAFH